MKTIIKARWSTLAIAVAAASSVSVAVAQEFTRVDTNAAVTEHRINKQLSKIPTRIADEQKAFTDTRRYLIEFVEPPVATYKGGIAGFVATSAAASGAERLDLKAKPVQTYAGYLNKRQDTVLREVTQRVPQLTAKSHMTLAFNGAVVEYAGDDLKDRLRGIPGIKAVHEDHLISVSMDASNDLIGSSDVWQLLGGQDAAGKGINVAVIDTGIDFDHPMFADNGHDRPDLGITDDFCALNTGVCNDKLIVARAFTPPSNVGSSETETPQDVDGHGSHVAGTAVGNPTSITYDGVAVNFSGVAPGANLMVYKALYVTTAGTGSGSSISLAEALNAAAEDGADVINNSWGGGAGGNPATSPYAAIMKSLDEMGVVTVTAAGNDGRAGAETIGCPGCVEETITVASTQTGRTFGSALEVTGLDVIDARVAEGDFTISEAITADLLPASQVDAANIEACNAFAAGAFTGQIALVSRGTCAFEQKANNVQAAGAIGLIIYNNEAGAFGVDLGVATLPTVAILQADGQLIETDWAVGMQATLNPTVATIDQAVVDIMSDFSSRGPNGDANMLKPEIAAPGHGILSAAPGKSYAILDGTSMASPHVAGAAALVLAHNPELTPKQVKSVMMTSAALTVKKEDALTPADPFDVGAGRLDLPAAINVGMTFDKASFADSWCMVECSFERVITSLDDAETTWNVSVSFDDPNIVATFPETITLDANGSIDFNLEIRTEMAAGDWRFGTLTFTDASGTYVDANLPIAVYNAQSDLESGVAGAVTAGEIAANNDITLSVITRMGTLLGDDVELTVQLPTDENVVIAEDSLVLTELRTTTTESAYDASTRTITWVGTQTNADNVSLANATFPYAGLGFDMIGGATYSLCTTGCDEAGWELPIGAIGSGWLYEGQSVDTIAFTSNGVMTVGGYQGTFPVPARLPSEDAPSGVIAPFWSDFMFMTGEGEIRYDIISDGIDTYLIIEWYNAAAYFDATYGDNTGTRYTFNAWFKLGTDEVYFNYVDVNQAEMPYWGSVIGVENLMGTVGETYFMDDGAGNVSGSYPTDFDSLLVKVGASDRAELQVDMNLNVSTFGDVSAATQTGAHSQPIAIDLTDSIGDPKRDLITLINVTSGEQSYDAFIPVVIKPDGDLSTEVTAQPANGSVVVDGMTATYTPTAGWVGNDSFTYRVTDEAGATSTENSIEVTVTNTAPVISVRAPSTVSPDTIVVLNAAGTTDAEGDTLTYQWQFIGGATVSLSNANTAAARFIAPRVDEDSEANFLLTVSDGITTSQKTVKVAITAYKSSGSFGWLFTLLALPLVWLRRRKV
ncbi:GlyGly-CTERM sorting domain-containing protein [Pseudidiomarina gelatinasegens]|uniref:GlyGly-CTERM sorting domain-containing protein n=1 Tax=Pseudidiomarina gelatinasegens TaxID=2487740 RepID=A0A443Z813_9GAMM|nr:S8 family serine peptidase [Pseudidiomarina gelatinasegens]RWU13068.1 GlyGly-CTERM sorting domain-containing protein [Pseudidiomarina gelatinasegens]